MPEVVSNFQHLINKPAIFALQKLKGQITDP